MVRAPRPSAEKYVLPYEPLTICPSHVAPTVDLMDLDSPPNTPGSRLPASSGMLPGTATVLFVVERRLPEVNLSRAEVRVAEEELSRPDVRLARDVIRERVPHQVRMDWRRDAGSLADASYELPEGLL